MWDCLALTPRRGRSIRGGDAVRRCSPPDDADTNDHRKEDLMKRSYLIALVLTFVIIAWMSAGQFAGPSQKASPNDAGAVLGVAPMAVEVRTQRAQPTPLRIMAHGQVEPNRMVTIRAEAAGRITKVATIEGQALTLNDVLMQIDMNDRQARLKKADAKVKERQRSYERTKQLVEKGHLAQQAIDESFSALESAKADLAEIQLEIRNTAIRAPFDGVLEVLHVEVGDYASVNRELATIVDNHLVVVVVQIAQQDISKLSLGSVARIAFATGQEREGVVRFIASRAEPATRTFRVEIEVPNPEGVIPSGTTAQAHIPTGEISAQYLSPALLVLDESGKIGAKTVSDAGYVEFHPVTIVRAEAEGVWVSGLPDEIRLITVGQNFVREGEPVHSVEDSSTSEDSRAKQRSAQPAPEGGARVASTS